MTGEMACFGRRVFAAVLIVGLIVAVAYSIQVLLLVFAGILLAVFFRSVGSCYDNSLDKITASAISRMERRVFMLCC